jgi:hypothetical protein
MRTLESNEVQEVGGGDSWAGTADGRAPFSPFHECVSTAGLVPGADGLGVLLFCAYEELLR